MTIKDNLIDAIGCTTYDKEKKKNEAGFWDTFADIANSLYLRIYHSDLGYLPDLSDGGYKEVLKEMRATLEMNGKTPIFAYQCSTSRDIIMRPVAAQMYNVQSGDEIYLSIGATKSIKKAVNVSDSFPINTLGDLIGIGLCNEDFRNLISKDPTKHMDYVNCSVKKISGQQTPAVDPAQIRI